MLNKIAENQINKEFKYDNNVTHILIILIFLILLQLFLQHYKFIFELKHNLIT